MMTIILSPSPVWEAFIMCSLYMTTSLSFNGKCYMTQSSISFLQLECVKKVNTFGLL